MFNNLTEIFKTAVSHNASWDKTYEMVFHSHKTLEIVYLLKGIMTIKYYADENSEPEEVMISANQFAIVLPHVVHKYVVSSDACFFSIYELVITKKDLTFHDYIRNQTFVSQMPDILKLLDQNPNLLVFTDNADILNQLKHLANLSAEENKGKNDITHQVDYSLSLQRLLFSITNCRPYKYNLHGNVYIRKCSALIQDRYMEKISVDSLAEELGISASYLQRQFKKTVGKSVFEVITIQRLKQAERLLLTTNLSVKDIAVRVGFQSLNSFYKTFTKEYKCSPTNFRSEHMREITTNENVPHDYFDWEVFKKYN